MMEFFISSEIKEAVPSFQLGIITYNDITVTNTPQWLQGRLQLSLEEWLLEKENVPTSEITGVQAWRKLFKLFGTDPSRYRPSHEALIRRLRKEKSLPSIHTAADVNNYFSITIEAPMGIYDLDHLDGDVTLRIGKADDHYMGINGREMAMASKFLTADASGAFGSPIVDSKRSMVTEETRNALHVIYFNPDLHRERAEKILDQIGRSFIQFNGGEIRQSILL